MKCLALLLIPVAITAQIKFTHIESPNFELYTDGSKSRAIDILEHFEKVRSFFAKTISPRESHRKPRVVVLNSTRAFAAFVDRKNTAAYYIGLPHRDLIVIGPAGKGDDNRIITHEYTHMLVHQADMRIPLWMNEGIAEVYSTLQPAGDKMRVGTPIANHMLRLRHNIPDIREVLKAETYGSEEHAGMFYSMSWAIAHMMLLEDDLRVKWPRFLIALEKGMPPEQALKQIYGMTPQQLEQHVQGYIRGTSMNIVDFDFKWQAWKEKAQSTAATELENGLTMIDLHLSGKNREAAIRHAERLGTAFPKAVEPWEALAAAHINEGNFEGAANAIREAFARGSDNPSLLARGASFTISNRALAGQMIDRAIMSDHEHFEALLQLTAWHMQGQDYASAFAAARRINRISRDDTPRYMAAYVQSATLAGETAAALAAVKDFRAYALSERDKAAAEKLARFVERGVGPAMDETAATAVVTGLLVEVVCANNGQVLRVETGQGVREITIDPRQALVLEGEDFNVGCGPQKRKRRIRVGVSPEGLARKLEFLP